MSDDERRFGRDDARGRRARFQRGLAGVVERRGPHADPAVGDRGERGGHLEQRHFRGSERERRHRRQWTVDSHGARDPRHVGHADALRNEGGWNVQRRFKGAADRHRSVEASVDVVRRPGATDRGNDDGLVGDDGRRRELAGLDLERGEIYERLEERAGLTSGLRRPVELAVGEAPSSHQGEDPARAGLDRHHRGLKRSRRLAPRALDLSQTVSHRCLGRLLKAPIKARDYTRTANRADGAVRHLVPGQLHEPGRSGRGRPRPRPHRTRLGGSCVGLARRALAHHRLENPVAAVAEQRRRLGEDPVRRPDRRREQRGLVEAEGVEALSEAVARSGRDAENRRVPLLAQVHGVEIRL